MNVNSINSTNFGAKTKEGQEYKKTHLFKTTGAIVGGGLTTIGLLVAQKKQVERANIPAGYKLLAIAGTALFGGLLGTVTDTVINKTVKNVVSSLKTEPFQKTDKKK